LFIKSGSLENKLCSLPLLLTALVFILFEEGGVDSMAKQKEIKKGTLQNKVNAERKTTYCFFVRKNNQLF